MSKHKPSTYWWFQGPTVVALADALLKADPETARLEVRLDEEDEHMTLTVVPAATGAQAAGATVLNESHTCPPVCS